MFSVNYVEIIKFKARYSEIKETPMCLGNISKYFSVNIKMKNTGLYGFVYNFSVDYDAIAVDNILESLMKKHDIKQCLSLLKTCLLWWLRFLD